MPSSSSAVFGYEGGREGGREREGRREGGREEGRKRRVGEVFISTLHTCHALMYECFYHSYLLIHIIAINGVQFL